MDRMSNEWTILRHLTWAGRAEAVWYALRRLAVRPASGPVRCAMGSPVSPLVWCPREADGDLWCSKHRKQIAGSSRRQDRR